MNDYLSREMATVLAEDTCSSRTVRALSAAGYRHQYSFSLHRLPVLLLIYWMPMRKQPRRNLPFRLRALQRVNYNTAGSFRTSGSPPRPRFTVVSDPETHVDFFWRARPIQEATAAKIAASQ